MTKFDQHLGAIEHEDKHGFVAMPALPGMNIEPEEIEPFDAAELSLIIDSRQF